VAESSIEWTDSVWNPVTGCSKVSPGCAHCYAEALTMRFASSWGVPRLPWTPANAAENVILHPDRLAHPLRWKQPRMVFVNSMSDLFHEQVPDEFIARVFAVMAAASQHTFQVLTKRPERMRDLLNDDVFAEWVTTYACEWVDRRGDTFLSDDAYNTAPATANVWLGVSIENRRFVHRADLLRETPAAVRFISAEPLLGPLVGEVERPAEGAEDDAGGASLIGSRVPRVGEAEPHTTDQPAAASSVRSTFGTGATIGTPEPVRLPDSTPKRGALDLTDIDWLIVGGESGPKARMVDANWVRALRAEAIASSTRFFFKQWGGVRPQAGGRVLDGRTWDDMPEVLAHA